VNDPGNRFTTIHDALNDAQSGSYVSVYLGNYILTQNETVPSSVTLYLQSGSNVSLDDYSITTTSGTITVESNATLNPDIRLQSGSAIKGLYPTIASAFTAATSGQWVHIRGTHTFTDHFTVSSGKVLKTESGTQMNFASNKYLYVYGNLYGVSSTYTGSSGTWGGIKYYSGSSGSIQYSNINNAYVAVYANNSNPTVSHNNISNCTYGIYAFYGSPVISNCTISNDLVKNVEV
jgi:parallel beta-helix repeat protein